MRFPPQDRTNNLFKQVYEQKSLKGRANDAIASACLYIACRQEGVPRTFKGQTTSGALHDLLRIEDASVSHSKILGQGLGNLNHGVGRDFSSVLNQMYDKNAILLIDQICACLFYFIFEPKYHCILSLC